MCAVVELLGRFIKKHASNTQANTLQMSDPLEKDAQLGRVTLLVRYIHIMLCAKCACV